MFLDDRLAMPGIHGRSVADSVRYGARPIKLHHEADAAGDIRIRDLASHRVTLLQGPRFVGNGRQAADQMEEWFTSGACDGFVRAATDLPGEGVVRIVVPELPRRGLFRRSYAGDTLRVHLGLDKPSIAPAMSQGGAGA